MSQSLYKNNQQTLARRDLFLTWFLPATCEWCVSEDSCLEPPPGVCERCVSENSFLEPPPGVCERCVSEDSCLEPPPGVCEWCVSEDSCLEPPPGVCELFVSEDSCLELPPVTITRMWMNKTVQAKNSPPHLHQCKFSEITEIVWYGNNYCIRPAKTPL